MYQSAPVRSRQSYRHEAFLWHDGADFIDAMVTFVEEGLAADESVLVALVEEHSDWLRDGLGPLAASVHFEDMRVFGRNPARLIPAWQQFLDLHSGPGRPARGIGEPIWVGRRPEEVLECQLHEALLNVAFDADTPFWLVCPYNATRLDEPVISEAHRSHHAILDVENYRGSTSYGGRAHVEALFHAQLPPLPGQPATTTFTEDNLQEAFAFVLAQACAADLWSDSALDLAAAARLLAADSLRRGAEVGVVRVARTPDAVVCDVVDDTVLDDVLAGRRSPVSSYDEGLWSANQLCRLVAVRSTQWGTTVRLYA
ncbi:MAG TPA: MEDS domain-containing protein [Propionibacteriaceae bacterium]|nr:MEDS domain-containing protein [Propionibacteriaceae bacterium]